jgi:NADPH-dependent ferric siderophore reductase
VRAWLAARPALVRDAAAGRPQPLPHVDVDRRLLWEAPERAAGNGLYAWVAGEAGVVRALRRCLVSEHGVDRRRVAFMGYWRLGQAERA